MNGVLRNKLSLSLWESWELVILVVSSVFAYKRIIFYVQKNAHIVSVQFVANIHSTEFGWMAFYGGIARPIKWSNYQSQKKSMVENKMNSYVLMPCWIPTTLQIPFRSGIFAVLLWSPMGISSSELIRCCYARIQMAQTKHLYIGLEILWISTLLPHLTHFVGYSKTKRC